MAPLPLINTLLVLETTTTAGRNAGVSTAAGTIVYNSQTDKLEVYTGNLWASVF